MVCYTSLTDCNSSNTIAAPPARPIGSPITLPFRLFSSSTPCQASAPTKKGGKLFRDPYVVTQARARKAANISRQDALAKERFQALGDPVRGQTTSYVESFDLGRDPDSTTTLNHFLRPDEISVQLETSKALLKPLPVQYNATMESEAKHATDEEKKLADYEVNHEEVHAALQRIINLDNGSSKDRLRSNMQRCIQTFGRHETDQILPPKPRATPLMSIKALRDQRVAIEGASDRAERKDIKRIGPDTGSSEVQIAILTAKIRGLANHLGSRGRKDKVGKRDLRLLVHRRQKLLQYLKRKERGGPRWQRCVETLGLTEGTWQGEISL